MLGSQTLLSRASRVFTLIATTAAQSVSRALWGLPLTMYKKPRCEDAAAAHGRLHSYRFGRPSTGVKRVAVAPTRPRRRRGLWAVLRNAAALQIDGCACWKRARRLSSETLKAARSATRWQERAKMTDASQNTPGWTAGGPPRTVPSSLSPGAARRAGRPHHASRPARAPARSSWHGGVCQATGRASLAARAGGALTTTACSALEPPPRRRDPST